MPYETPYNENYPSCQRTYATLRIFHRDLDPDEVTQLLGVSPSESFRCGDPYPPKPGRVRPHGCWLLCSKHLPSRDLRHHLDWLLQYIGHHRDAFALLQQRDYSIDIPCYWSSTQGEGGPTFSPSQMRTIGELGIELWIDFY